MLVHMYIGQRVPKGKSGATIYHAGFDFEVAEDLAREWMAMDPPAAAAVTVAPPESESEPKEAPQVDPDAPEED